MSKTNQINIAYPISTADFIKIQQEAIGRELNTFEKELSAEYVDLINLSYEAGKSKQEPPISREDIVSYFAERDKLDVLGDSAVTHLLSVLLFWTENAYQAGLEAKA